MPHHIALRARACEIAGQIEEAVTQLDDALQILERTGVRWLAAELYRHKGQLLLRQGHPETAEELYRKALSISGEQQAKLWELRAAATRAATRKPPTFSPRSTAGSPKGSTHKTSKKQRHCSTNSTEPGRQYVQRSGANDSFLADPTTRWRGR